MTRPEKGVICPSCVYMAGRACDKNKESATLQKLLQRVLIQQL